MSLNRQTTQMLDVSEEEFVRWCKQNHKKKNSIRTKREFFRKLYLNQIDRSKIALSKTREDES